MLIFLLGLGSLTLGQTSKRPEFAPLRDKHRNESDELGQKQGLWKYYNRSKELLKEIEYRNNKREGLSKRYYVGQKVMEECNYFESRREGEYKKYYFTGEVNIEGTYVNGMRDGPWKTYFDDGNLKQEGSYKRGLKDGTWKVYSKKGNVISESVFKDGIDVKAAQASATAASKPIASGNKKPGVKAGVKPQANKITNAKKENE